MTEYNILAKVTIDTSGVQAQLSQKSYSLPVKATVQLDENGLTSQMNNQVTKWNNSLSNLKVNNPLAFNNEDVQKQEMIFNDMAKAAQTGLIPIQDVNTQLGTLRSTVTQTSSATESFTGTIAKDISKVAEWLVATTLIIGAIQQLGAGIQYIVALNTAMTQTQMVTGDTDTQIQQLVDDYNKMATALGTTTLEVQAANLVWLRQGKSAADATELTKDSIEMSKLAMTDTTTAAQYLTAIMNGFQMSASDATGVMDKMLALSNSTKTSAAVSFDTLSAAMQVSAAEANNTGISFANLASYIN